MSEEHVHDWLVGWEAETEQVIARCENLACDATMGGEEIEARLNATEVWSADDARRLSNTCMSMQGKAIHGKGYPSLRESAIAYWKSRVVKLLAYADAREGK